MAGAETGVSSAEKVAFPCERMIWNRGWEFRLEDEPGKSTWQTVHLPHTFSLPYFMSDSFYTGRGTYRKKLVMPEEWQGEEGVSGLRRSFPGGGGEGEREDCGKA